MKYAVSRHQSGVWASDENPVESASRLVAIDVMVALGLDPTDFKTRDKIIVAICDRINGTLDYVHTEEGPLLQPRSSPRPGSGTIELDL